MHGADGCQILLDHRIERASAFGDVATQAANETNVVGRVDENLDVHLFQQTRLGKDQNAFDDDDGLGIDTSGVGQTSVRAKIVNRQLNRLAGSQLLQVVNQQIVIEGVGMIKVGLVT